MVLPPPEEPGKRRLRRRAQIGANERLRISYVKTGSIRPRPNNPRTHSQAQIEKIAEAIRRFGFVAPILIDEHGYIIAGHGRYLAALARGLKIIPVIRIVGRTDAQIRAMVIADNQLAQLSSWDETILKIELKALVLDETLSFPPSVTGFDNAKIDALVFDGDFGASDPADATPAEPPSPTPITVVGDVWRTKRLTLVCGDARNPESYVLALDGLRAIMVLTDPPFNVRIQGHVSGKGKVRHREFVEGAGEKSEAEFTEFLATPLRLCVRWLAPGGLIYCFMDGAHLFELLTAGRMVGLTQKAFITWAKTNAGMGSLYRSQTEHVVLFKADNAAHTNNVQLGRFGRNRTTLWSYPGANAFGRNRDAALAAHPTVKPVAMLADAILDATERDDLVLDPFAGSGSTLIAAHRVGRRAAGIELDPLYVDGALARIAALTSEDPVRASDGARWSDLVRGVGP